jgi:thioester reductase-like protein
MQEFKDLLAFDDLVPLIRKNVSAFPDRVPLEFVRFVNQDQQVYRPTLADLDRRARSIAVHLTNSGLVSGDRVTLLASQSADDVIMILACLYARVVFSLIPPPTDAVQAQRLPVVLSSSQSKLVMAGHGLSQMLGARLLPLLGAVPFLDIGSCHGLEDAWREQPLNEGGMAYLQYTSGSTSAPKAIVVSHGNVIHNLSTPSNIPADRYPRTYVSWAPFSHNVGLMTLLTPLVSQVKMVIMSPLDFMSQPLRWFQLITQYKAEGTFGPNSAYMYCCKAIAPSQLDGVDLSTLRIALNGAEPVDYTSLKVFAEKFGSVGFQLETFMPGYGLGESTSGVTRADAGLSMRMVDPDLLKKNIFQIVDAGTAKAKSIVSVGQILPGLDLAVVDPETGRVCEPGRIGELWVKGPSVALGYWQNDRATTETFRATLPGTEGFWLRTGDLGTVDGQDVFVTGRLKEVIIINGHNFYPYDIEETLRSALPQLLDSRIATFSFNDEGKEKVVCCLENSPAIQADVHSIVVSIAKTVARVYEFSPADVLVVKEGSLPRTANQKLQTLQVRDLYVAGKLEPLASLKQEIAAPANSEQPVETLSDDEKTLQRIFQKALGSNEVRLDDHFFLLGGDSIAIAQVVSEISESFGIDIPIKYLLDNPSIRSTSQLIQSYKKSGSFEGMMISGEQLKQECVLDVSIQPPTYGDADPAKPRNIFLTGSTGFVGAYLIRDLMRNTNATLYCHVRAKSVEHGLQRLKENLASYELWQDAYAARLVPVLGDLGEPQLGISSGQYQELAETLDVIYHNGALLNFVYPYQRLKTPNVLGTVECLRLACEGKAKFFHHVSTFSVYDNPSHFGKVVSEEDPLEDPTGYFLGYTESKWVAEKLVKIAFSRGLKGTIHRPGEITGAADTGIWKMTDAVIRSLITSIQAGVLPEGNLKFHMTPVDYVSGAIVELSLQQASLGKSFNLVNKSVKRHSELAEFFKSMGYPLDVVSFEEWKNRIFAMDSDHAFKPLETLLKEVKPGQEAMERRYGDAEAIFDTTQADEGLKGSQVRCAPVDAELLTIYFRYFRKAGYLS